MLGLSKEIDFCFVSHFKLATSFSSHILPCQPLFLSLSCGEPRPASTHATYENTACQQPVYIPCFCLCRCNTHSTTTYIRIYILRRGGSSKTLIISASDDPITYTTAIDACRAGPRQKTSKPTNTKSTRPASSDSNPGLSALLYLSIINHQISSTCSLISNFNLIPAWLPLIKLIDLIPESTAIPRLNQMLILALALSATDTSF